ncbi:MAG: thioredoxin domain-containing protein [Chlamydiae bacterium]|nr:thioredoxin domain-containing protein [Chlamydiota bacterium]
MKKDKTLVIVTIAVFTFIVFTAALLDKVSPVAIDVHGQLTFGKENATVQVVVFEDLLCPYCKDLTKDIFPQIKKDYIDSGKIKYTIIPVAVLYGSKNVANAVLGVYELNKNNDNFFAYVDEVCQTEDVVGKDKLLEFAQSLNSVDTAKLKEFINDDHYSLYLQHNLEMAKKIMRKNFSVPGVYINGRKVDSFSFEEVSSRIDEALKGK